jgi:hypothetical protein
MMGLLLEVEMKKLLAIATASLMVAGLTIGSASAKHRHHHSMHSMTTGSSMQGGTVGMGRGANNAELKGNSATSAGGSNSLANTNNPGGMGNNAGPPMR